MSKIIQLAGCLISNQQGKILLLHRQTAKRQQWETPGGKVEPDEDPAQAAIREVKEEIGVVVNLTQKLGEKEFLEDGYPFHYVWFQADIIKGKPSIKEPEKFTEYDYLSWQQMGDIYKQLSANAKNLYQEHQAGNITLQQ